MRGWVEKIPGRLRQGGTTRAKAGTRAPDEWRVRYQDPTDPENRLSAGIFKIQREAKEALRQVFQDIDTGQHVRPSILEIAERHGHDPAVTLRDYGHLKDDAQVELTNRLDARTSRRWLSKLVFSSPSRGAVVGPLEGTDRVALGRCGRVPTGLLAAAPHLALFDESVHACNALTSTFTGERGSGRGGSRTLMPEGRRV